ncbi:MAG: nucleotidyl transferase AbiEii/AbiGii toxin family protein [Bacteroidales bacterium]|nr:nucleotidyl transferase AbiEii/AbiGii toxin family protein [Bacteroidales bacterium]
MLQTRTIEPATLGLLKKLMSVPYLDQFYLVGGTALALQLGHRMSVDIDLFTINNFDSYELIETLNKEYEISIESESANMLITYINNIKVDFVKMGYPLLYKPILSDNIRMLEIRDIAAMKLKAIMQRGSKKGFFDIYFFLQQMTLESLLQLFKKKFEQYELFYIIKSLTYFNDAENYADPIVFDKNVTWAKVKSLIYKEVKKLVI